MKLLSIKINSSKIIILSFFLHACLPTYSYAEETMKKSIEFSKKINEIFSKTKILCFGRYIIEVPNETELIIGTSAVDIISGGLIARDKSIKKYIDKIKFEDSTSEITYNQEGPIQGSWQFRYYKNDTGKKYNSLFFKSFINKGDITFILIDIVLPNETEAITAARQLFQANSLRLRGIDEIPQEPGLCIEYGFMRESQYNDQEIDNAGLYFPSLPDVTFSISSNKDAYGDYPPEEFEATVRAELSLLARIQGAKDIQGKNYPQRTLLREGKRDVQHWHGEESLIRRADGVHDFEWALVGTPRDIANPSVLEVNMYTKVQHNTVGAAQAASLSDDEAIALWDKLLSGLKFRVKVPGAPPGSYYIDPDKPQPAQAR